jgi:hypothetical protein
MKTLRVAGALTKPGTAEPYPGLLTTFYLSNVSLVGCAVRTETRRLFQHSLNGAHGALYGLCFKALQIKKDGIAILFCTLDL